MSIIDKNRAVCSLMGKVLANSSFVKTLYYNLGWTGTVYDTSGAYTGNGVSYKIISYISENTKLDIIDLGNSTVGWGLPLEALKKNMDITDYIYGTIDIGTKLKYTGPKFDLNQLNFFIPEYHERVNKSKTHIMLKTYSFATETSRLLEYDKGGGVHYKTITGIKYSNEDFYTRDIYIGGRAIRAMVSLGGVNIGPIKIGSFG